MTDLRTRWARPFLLAVGLGMALATFPVARSHAVPARAGNSSQRVTELQERLAELQVNVGFLSQQMKSADSRIRGIERKVAGKRADVEKIQADLAQFEQKQAAEASAAQQLETDLADTEARCKQVRERFRAWLVRLHKVRQGTLVTTLFSAGDLNAFLARYQLIRHLIHHDHQLLAELTQAESELHIQREAYLARKQKLAELTATTEATRNKLAAELNGLVALLNSLVLERKVYQKRQKALQEDLAGLERQIATVENARLSAPEQFDAALDTPDPGAPPAPPPPRHPAPPPLPPLTGTDAGTQAGAGTGHSGGPATGTIVVGPPSVPAQAPRSLRFAWPIAAIVRSQIADSDVVGGLELPISGEGQIMASERGKVLFRGPMGRLGNIVIIAHKNGYSTVYGRLDEIWVGMGQVVNRGDAIGKITPVSRQKLHFEIRLGGRGEPALSLLPRLGDRP